MIAIMVNIDFTIDTINQNAFQNYIKIIDYIQWDGWSTEKKLFLNFKTD